MVQRVVSVIRRAAWTALVAALICGASRLDAAVVWHETLAGAKAASLTSQRPVLVIFTAGWSEASDRFLQKTLVAPEAAAIISSCFEPIRLDVDSNGELAKRLGVSHLPSGCIIDQNDAVLARFDCPESSAEFVTNAARAIQTSAQGRVGTTPPPAVPYAATAMAPAAPPVTPPAAAAASRFGAAEPAVAPPLPATPPTWPAESASSPLNRSTASTGRGSAFSSAASDPPPTPPPPPTGPRQVIEPPTATPAWGSAQSQPPTAGAANPQRYAAAPAYAATPGYAAAPGYPAAPGNATTATAPAYPSTPSTPAYPTTPTAPAYPTTPGPGSTVAAYPSTTATLPIYSGTSSVMPPVPPPAAPPATTAEKPKSTNSFVAFFTNPMSLFSSSKPADKAEIAKPSASATPQPATPRNGSVASTVPGLPPAATADAYGSMPVGLEGYCPVTLVEKSVWVEGRPQWGVRHRGRTYLFAGPAEQQSFLAAPDRYAPALSGDDPVLAFDSGRQVPGQRRYGVTYQSRIYLFSSPESRSAFTSMPEKYATRVLVAENPQAGPGTFIR